jgi:hypothetical protein
MPDQTAQKYSERTEEPNFLSYKLEDQDSYLIKSHQPDVSFCMLPLSPDVLVSVFL